MKQSAFFKCLSNETRLRILILISREKSLCVCELFEALGESQPKISRHLAQLRHCGLLQDSRQSQWVFYQLADDLPDWAMSVLTVISAQTTPQTTTDKQRLAQMKNRPIQGL